MIKKLFILACLWFCNIVVAQNESIKDNDLSKFNIFLFGEMHFVNEKYVEFKNLFYSIVNDRKELKSITIALELPVSLNYGLNLLLTDNDSTIFCNYFNYHLYAQKDEKPSVFWIDFKTLLLDLVQYCDKNNIELNIQCVDIERRFRRTAYTLFELYNKYHLEEISLTQMMNNQIILDDEPTRGNLIRLCDYLISTSLNPTDSVIVTQIITALSIGCIHNCNEREVFMYDNFKSLRGVNFDENGTLLFGIFGLNHIVFSNHDIPNKYLQTDKSFSDYRPFISLFDKKTLSKTYRIGLTAFTMKYKENSPIEVPKKTPALLDKEKEYLELLLKGKNRISLFPNKHEVLQHFATEIDFLILYESSYYKN